MTAYERRSAATALWGALPSGAITTRYTTRDGTEWGPTFAAVSHKPP